MYDSTIYTPAVDLADRDALRDILRSAPLDEQAYTAHLDGYAELSIYLRPWNRTKAPARANA